MKFWQVAVLIGLGVLLGWFIWGRAEPPPPEIITETKTDTLERVDTVKIADPLLIAETRRLRGVVAGFLANPGRDTTDTCIVYLTQAAALIDSLNRAVTTRPALRLSLSDTLTFTWPVKALWVGVGYAAEGDSARITWSNRQWPAPLIPKSRFGVVFGYGAGSGGFVGAQIRLDQSKAIQAAKSEKDWQAGMVWYVK